MFDLFWNPGTVCCLSNYSLYFFKYMVSNSFKNTLLRFLSMIQMFLRYDCNSRRSSLTTLLNLTWLISLSSLGLSSLEILFFKYFGLSFVDFLIVDEKIENVSNDPKIPGNIILRLQRIRSTWSLNLSPNHIITKYVQTCCYIKVRVWGMPWPKTFATHFHAQFRFPDKSCVFIELVVCNIFVVNINFK